MALEIEIAQEPTPAPPAVAPLAVAPSALEPKVRHQRAVIDRRALSAEVADAWQTAESHDAFGARLRDLLKTALKAGRAEVKRRFLADNDGAAAVVLMSADNAEKRGAPVLARIKSWATAGVDPAIMGSGPIPASRKALEKAGWSAEELDLVEANEAFAAQACAVNKDLGWDVDKVNVNGGAIALGHPLGCTGTKLSVQLFNEFRQKKAHGAYGMVTMCVGTGQGAAGIFEYLGS